MATPDDVINTDVLVVGSGLGAIAAAKGLADHGVSVVLVPGIGSSRSRTIDGGLVDGAVLDAAFGPGAPLGDRVTHAAELTMGAQDRLQTGPLVPIPARSWYRRSDVETWAMERATGAGARYVDDFIEGRVLPVDEARVALTSGRDTRVVRARVIALCEGADPRIAMRVHLRPDYGPEDQIHFARAFVEGEPVPGVIHGQWRTGWGMPVRLHLYPLGDGTIVSLSTRIENVMRASRSSKDALRDFFDSRDFASVGIQGMPGEFGMELVAVRKNRRDMSFVHDRLVVGLDFSGVIDPRSLERADLTIAAGRHLAAYLIEHELRLEQWPVVATRFIEDTIPLPTPYHDDSATGYLEEGGKQSLAKRLAGIMRRGNRVKVG